MNDFSNRRLAWQPPARPAWLQQVNAEGACLDLKGVVPLDADGLIAAAVARTGLSDFGEGDALRHFRLLTQSFDSEAELNLFGRIATRSDMLIFLAARLQIEHWFKLHPEIADEKIDRPLMIIGQGRSGTSFLHNLLAHDPDNAVIRTWEALFPCPPPEAASYQSDPRIARADKLVTQINRITPEIAAMHEFHGAVPADCALVHCLTFNSPAWLSPICGQAPGYVAEVLKDSVVPVYQYEKKLLQLLQWRHPRSRWILKSPYSINHIPEILQVFPDMGFIWPHRDPVKALSSMVDLLGISFWGRSDHPFIGDSMALYTNADIGAAMMTRPIEWLESGVLPRAQLLDLRYQDLVGDSVGTIERIYRHFGMELTATGRAGMLHYLDQHPRSTRPAHRYDVGDDSLVSAERKAFSAYQAYFWVPSEP